MSTNIRVGVNRGASANNSVARFARVVDLSKQLSGNLIVVGDLHGCLAEFEAILQKTQYDPRKDRLVIIGDLVCKGYDSVGVVKRCMALGALAVLGNYDATLLGAIRSLERGDTNVGQSLDPVVKLAAQFPRDCAAWLRQLPHIIRVPQYNVILVHAGINPRYPLDKQDVWEVTHMRKVMHNGEIRAKSEAGIQWAELWQGPETVVFGHDARSGLQNLPYAKGIDSGCVYGGELTAILFPARVLVSVPGWQGHPRRGIDEESVTPSESNYRQPTSSPEPRAASAVVLPVPLLKPSDVLMHLSLAPSADRAIASGHSTPSVTPLATPTSPLPILTLSPAERDTHTDGSAAATDPRAHPAAAAVQDLLTRTRVQAMEVLLKTGLSSALVALLNTESFQTAWPSFVRDSGNTVLWCSAVRLLASDFRRNGSDEALNCIQDIVLVREDVRAQIEQEVVAILTPFLIDARGVRFTPRVMKYTLVALRSMD